MTTQAATWRDSAACADTTTPDIFFPRSWADLFEAQLMCASCPARIDCLMEAADRREHHGVWGGRLFGRPVSGADRQARLPLESGDGNAAA